MKQEKHDKRKSWYLMLPPVLLTIAVIASCGGGGGGGTILPRSTPHAPGSLNLSFGGTGIVTTALGSGNEDITAVAIQSDRKIVVAGYSLNSSGNNDFALVRYNPDGSLDTAFDTDGIVTTPIGAANDSATAVAIQSDGKIVVAGGSLNSSGDYDFALARYNPDGSLDAAFDTDGMVTTPIGAAYDYATAVAIRSDGKILVAGYSLNSSGDYDFALARYRADGSVDTMGLCFPPPCTPPPAIVTTPIGSSHDQAFALAIQGDGKIVVAGKSINSSGNTVFTLVRYSVELFGVITPDTTFDTDGIVTTPIGAAYDYATAVAIQSDGKIVAAGGSSNSSGINDVFALARYNPDGSLDATFDADGVVTTPIGAADDYDYATAVAIQSDGKIVVAGDYSNSSDFALARYNPDGSLDAAFDTDGIVTTPIGAANDSAAAVAIQSDGKIVVAGYSLNSSGNNDFALARYWP